MSKKEFKIGDVFLINNDYYEIKDYTIIKMHKKRDDHRTKKVDTVVWSLFNAKGNIEYRKTNEDLYEMYVIGLYVDKEKK